MKTFDLTILLSALATAHPAALRERQEDFYPIINYYRRMGGLSDVTRSQVLVDNAYKTLNESPPGIIRLQLNPGTLAQVGAVRSIGQPFDETYVESWLCERPQPYIADRCSNTDPQDTTGNADILLDPRWTQAGCAPGNDLVYCDFA